MPISNSAVIEINNGGGGGGTVDQVARDSIAVVANDLSTQTDRIDLLSTSVDIHTGELSTLSTELSTQAGLISDNTAQISTLDTTVETNQENVTTSLDAILNRLNEAGVVLASFSGITLGSFTANVAKKFTIPGGTINTALTTFPRSAPSQDIFALIKSSKLIENPVLKQPQKWRVNYQFSGKTPNSVVYLDLTMRNPDSGFVASDRITLPSGITNGNITSNFEITADQSSISTGGYELEATVNSSGGSITISLSLVSISRTTHSF